MYTHINWYPCILSRAHASQVFTPWLLLHPVGHAHHIALHTGLNLVTDVISFFKNKYGRYTKLSNRTTDLQRPAVSQNREGCIISFFLSFSLLALPLFWVTESNFLDDISMDDSRAKFYYQTYIKIYWPVKKRRPRTKKLPFNATITRCLISF